MVKMRSLIEAYGNTTFRIETPDGRVSLRPNLPCLELDQLLSKNQWEHAAVITAFNPRSIEMSKEENELANLKLEKSIVKDDYPFFPGVGQGDDPNWQPEDSFLICDITLKLALEIAEEFGQYAIAFHTQGQETSIELTEVVKAAPD